MARWALSCSVLQVWLALSTDGAKSGEVEVRKITGADCGCLNGSLGCTHEAAAMLGMFGLRRNSAAVGRAKQAPTKPGNAKAAVKMSRFGVGGDTLVRFLEESSDLDTEERELLEKMRERGRRKKEKKEQKKKTKKGGKKNKGSNGRCVKPHRTFGIRVQWGAGRLLVLGRR